MAGRKQHMAPMWKKWMKFVGLGEPTSFLDHVYWRCTQRECKSNDALIEQYTKMFESRISAGAENLPGWDKLHAKTVAWSYDMEGHPKKCVERFCELANKKDRQSSCTKSQLLAWMTITSKKGGPGISWRALQSMLTDCLEMLVFGTNW